MYCSNCGMQVPDGTRQCPNCGKPVGPPSLGSPPPLPVQPPLPAKPGSPKMIWVVVGCVVIPVVIGIIGIIAAILIPNFLDALQKAKQKRAVQELQTIGQTVEAYRIEHGATPEASDMEALASALSAPTLPRVDPWKHPYRYGCWQEASTAGCDHYRLVSGGSDGIFEHDDLSAYARGGFERYEYKRDIVFGDGEFIAGPGFP
jgi:general secretion pathway protein G